MDTSSWKVGKLLISLIVLELVLSVIFLILSHFINSMYFHGVGIGLVIAWVTSALAYLKFRMDNKKKK